MKRKILIAGSVVVGLLVVAVLGLAVFLDANQFRPKLEDAMGSALGRRVSVGNIRLALFSGGISLEDLSIADDPAFSAAPFVTAKAVSVGIDLMPLIFSRSLRVESFRLEAPQVVLLRSASGQWNFSRLGTSSTSQSGGSTVAMSVLIQKVAIAAGRVVVGNPGARGKDHVYEDVSLDVTNLSYTSQFPFRIGAKTPGGGTLGLEGTAGPFNVTDAAASPFQATLNVNHLDIALTGLVDPASGLAGVVDFAGTLASDGRRLNSKGKLNATRTQLVAGGAPSRVPIEIDYEADHDLRAQSGVVKQGDVHVGKALTRLTGDYNAGGETTTVRMKLAGRKIPVSELEAAMPAIGLTLPSGASLRQGTLDIDLAISGPLDRLVINGPLNLSNATVAGFDLGAKLGPVASFPGLPKNGETIIETLSSTLRIAPEGIRADNLNLIVPAIGSLSGSGTIAPKGDMDFRMLARLTGSGAVSGRIARATSLGQPANGTPFLIRGTTANPIFVPDAKAAVTNVLKNPETATKAVSALGGLFGRKKR